MDCKKILVGFSGNFEAVLRGLEYEVSQSRDKNLWPEGGPGCGIGGTSVDLAIGLKRFDGGNICRLLLTVGKTDDPFRQMLSATLTNFGVDHHMLPVRQFTSWAIIRAYRNGVTKIDGQKGPYLRLPKSEVEQQTREFAPDVVVATGVMPEETELVLAMFGAAPEESLQVLNPRSELIAVPDRLDEVLLATDLLIVNHVEAAELLGGVDWQPGQSLDSIHRRWGISEIVVTCGPAGAVLSSQGTATRQPAVDCGPVIHTDGAGDSFTVGFLGSRLDGKTSKESLHYAAVSAGITVARDHGSMSPTREEIEAVMAQQA